MIVRQYDKRSRFLLRASVFRPFAGVVQRLLPSLRTPAQAAPTSMPHVLPSVCISGAATTGTAFRRARHFHPLADGGLCVRRQIHALKRVFLNGTQHLLHAYNPVFPAVAVHCIRSCATVQSARKPPISYCISPARGCQLLSILFHSRFSLLRRAFSARIRSGAKACSHAALAEHELYAILFRHGEPSLFQHALQNRMTEHVEIHVPRIPFFQRAPYDERGR